MKSRGKEQSGWEATVGTRLRLADEGDWAALWRDTQSNGRRGPRPNRTPEPVRRMRRVRALLEVGEISRALAAAYPRGAPGEAIEDFRALQGHFPQADRQVSSQHLHAERAPITVVEGVRKRIEAAIP